MSVRRLVPGSRSAAVALALLGLLAAGAAGCGDAGGARDPPRADAAGSAARSPGTRPERTVAPEEEGREAYARGDYTEAIRPWETALAEARASDDRAAEARLLTSLGLAAWRIGDFGTARERGEEAVRVELRHGLDDLLPRSYNALGLLAWEQSRFGEAITEFEQALAAAEKAGDLEYVTKSIANLGLVYEAVGEFGTARERYLTALAAARKLGDARTEGRILVNLAALDRRAGDLVSAVAWLDTARAMDLGSFDPTGEEALWGQVASVRIQLGDARLAVAALDTALRLARAQGLRQAEAANQELLAEVHRRAGDHRRALRLYEQAAVLNEELGLATEAGDDLRAQAQILAALGHGPLARERVEEALALHRSVDAAFNELEDLLVAATLAESAGEPEAADARLADARSLAARLDAPMARLEVGLAEARIADGREDAEGTLRALEAESDELALAGDATVAESERLRARALAGRGDLEAAATAGRRAVEAVERLRAGHGSGALRTALAADRTAVYVDLVETLLRLGRAEEAFEVADAARGRVFRESLGATTRRDAGSSTWTRGIAAEEELLARIDALSAGIREAEEWEDEAGAAELGGRLRAARRDYEALRIRRRELAPVAEARGVSAGAAAVRAALGPDEALLAWLVGPERLTAFVVTPDTVAALRVAETADGLAARVRLARGLVSDPSTAADAAREVLRALDSLLVGPARETGLLDGASRLVLVPHHALAYLPFAALQGPDGRVLVETHEIVVLPAAAALPAIRAGSPRRETAGGTTRAAGPATPGAPAALRAAVFAPRPRELPASREEAETLRALLPGVDVRIGDRATERALREALGADGVVHVASHGVLNRANPLFSRLELAPGEDASPGPDDGRLEVHEILDLTVRSPLVFLSGCETGLGTAGLAAAAPGEDFTTLARSFLYAGAGGVAATLWPVADEGAAAFAARFYERLESHGAAGALAAAQREMRADPRWAHPYYWAGYQVAGRGGPTAATRPANRSSASVSR